MERFIPVVSTGVGVTHEALEMRIARQQAEAEAIARAVAEKQEAQRKADERFEAHKAAVAAKIMKAAAERQEAERQQRRDAEERHYRNDARKRFEAAGGKPGDFEAAWPQLWQNHLIDKAAGRKGIEPDLSKVWRATL